MARATTAPFVPPLHEPSAESCVPNALPERLPDDAVILYIPTYRHASEIRQRENEAAITANVSNAQIHLIVILPEDERAGDTSLLRTLRPRGTYLYQESPTGRLTFGGAFRTAGRYATRYGPNVIHMLANTDIVCPPKTVERIRTHLEPGVCWCLTRWDKIGLDLRLKTVICSQDTWIWRGALDVPEADEIVLGKGACDNAVAERLGKKFSLLNPSRSVLTIHIHESDIRAWTRCESKPPYRTLEPHHLGESPSVISWQY